MAFSGNGEVNVDSFEPRPLIDPFSISEPGKDVIYNHKFSQKVQLPVKYERGDYFI